jgi:hypothetical protein
LGYVNWRTGIVHLPTPVGYGFATVESVHHESNESGDRLMVLMRIADGRTGFLSTRRRLGYAVGESLCVHAATGWIGDSVALIPAPPERCVGPVPPPNAIRAQNP